PPLLLPHDDIDQLPGIRGPGGMAAGGTGGRSISPALRPIPGGDFSSDEPGPLELPGVDAASGDLDQGTRGGAGGSATGGRARGAERGSSSSGASTGSSGGDSSSFGDPNADPSGASAGSFGSQAGGRSSGGGLPVPVQMGGPGLNMKLGGAGQRR